MRWPLGCSSSVLLEVGHAVAGTLSAEANSAKRADRHLVGRLAPVVPKASGGGVDEQKSGTQIEDGVRHAIVLHGQFTADDDRYRTRKLGLARGPLVERLIG